MRDHKKLLLLWAVFLANVAHASGAQHSINWWRLGSEYSDAPALGWLTITFVIFVYGIVFIVKKPLSLYLETRSKDIRRQIEEGLKAKIESEEKLRLYDEKLRSLDSEIEKMKAAFAEQAQAESRERERATRELEARILRDAEDTIKANFERSKNRLAEEVVARAALLAKETIVQRKRDQVDGFLKSAFIDDLKTTAKEVH